MIKRMCLVFLLSMLFTFSILVTIGYLENSDVYFLESAQSVIFILVSFGAIYHFIKEQKKEEKEDAERRLRYEESVKDC